MRLTATCWPSAASEAMPSEPVNAWRAGRPLTSLALAVELLAAAGCAARLPTPSQSQRQVMLAIAEPYAIKRDATAATDDAAATATLISRNFALIVRHGLDDAEPAEFLSRSRSIRGSVIAEGSGTVMTTQTKWAWSLGEVLNRAADDWRLVRLDEPAEFPESFVPPPLAADALQVGDRILVGGWRPRYHGRSADFDDEHPGSPWLFRPDLWCTLARVVKIAPNGAFAFVSENNRFEGSGCSGGPAIRIDHDGKATMIVGIYVASYTGPAFPQMLRTYGVCAPIAGEVIAAVRDEPASSQD